MLTLPSLVTEPAVPTEQEARIARDSSQALAALVEGQEERPVRIRAATDSEHEAELSLPASVVRLLLGALQEMGKGNAVTLIPSQTELTTQQSADLLGVSRPFLIKLLDEGKIAFRKIGTHRRLRLQDVLRYRQDECLRRAKVMEELVAETECLGLYES